MALCSLQPRDTSLRGQDRYEYSIRRGPELFSSSTARVLLQPVWDFANLRVPGIIRLLSKINIKSYLYLSYKNPLLQVNRMQVLVKLILVTPCVGIIQALHNPTDKIETNRH